MSKEFRQNFECGKRELVSSFQVFIVNFVIEDKHVHITSGSGHVGNTYLHNYWRDVYTRLSN